MTLASRTRITLGSLAVLAASCGGPSDETPFNFGAGASSGQGGVSTAAGAPAAGAGAGGAGASGSGGAGLAQAGSGAGGSVAGAGGGGAGTGTAGAPLGGGAGVAAGGAPVGGEAGLATGGAGSGGGSAGIAGGESGAPGGGMAGAPAGGMGQGGAPMAGQAGSAMAGLGGGSPTTCTFTIDHSRATIATVEAVTWSTTLPSLTSATIEFGLSSGTLDMVAPVDLAEPNHRTLLLGMKQAESYDFRIVARSGDQVCTSDVTTLTTGTLSSVPTIQRTVMNESAIDRGFIITSAGLSNGPAYVIDSDGDIVWAATAPNQCSRARMSYDGKHLYMMSLNVQNLSMNGSVRRVAMDGTGAETLSGLNGAHHDFTVTPDNGIAVIVWSGQCTAIMERSAAGQLTTIVPNVDTTLYETVSDCHTNAINYNAHDGSYTLSDRNPNLFVKMTRAGALVWQLGGTNAKQGARTFTGLETWQVNHGHHWLADDTFVFFTNGAMGGTSKVLAYTLDETSGAATRTLSYQASGVNSPVLSDVQRLPSGNYLVTYSQSGQIHEISSTGTLVQRLSTTGFGYSEFRKSMYGPPLR